MHWPPAPPEEKVPAGHRTKEAVPLAEAGQRYPAGHVAGAAPSSHTAPGGHGVARPCLHINPAGHGS